MNISTAAHKTEDPPSCVLLWSKSAVYVHQTSLAKHNLRGFLAILRVDSQTLIAWLPEKNLTDQAERDKFVRIEQAADGQLSEVEEEAGTCSCSHTHFVHTTHAIQQNQH